MTVSVGSRVVVVEPHADDAFLSLGSTLEEWRRRQVAVDIVTVFGDSRRNREAAAYCAAIGADHYALGYRESGCGLTGPEPVLPVSVSQLVIDVRTVAGPAAQVIWPLGLRHPEHRAVGRAGAFDGGPRWRYVETPYQLVKRNAPELAEMLTDRVQLQAEPKEPAVWRHVGIFRSQSMFFHYNPPERLQAAQEIIVR